MFKSLCVISSDLQNIHKLDGIAGQIIKENKMEKERFPSVLISLTEAVTNAILHGNKSDFSKNVEILTKSSKEGVSIRVSDQGKGFDFLGLPDPTTLINRHELGGRGVFMINQLTDSCSYLDEGSTVEMFFKNH